MQQSYQARSSVSVGHLATLTARLGTPCQPSELEVQEALERGLGHLMSLEARQRLERRRSAESQAPRAQLTEEIDLLREALTKLRTVSQRGPTSWETQGFVLPAPRPSRSRR